MLPMETPPQTDAEGFLMDLEFARVERSSPDIITKRDISPRRKPGPGGMTPPAVSTKISFGPDVLRGAAMTVTYPVTFKF